MKSELEKLESDLGLFLRNFYHFRNQFCGTDVETSAKNFDLKNVENMLKDVHEYVKTNTRSKSSKKRKNQPDNNDVLQVIVKF